MGEIVIIFLMRNFVRVFVFCGVVFYLFTGCKSGAQKKMEREALARSAAVREYVAALSPEVKISQLFLVNIEGSSNFHAVEKTGSLYGKSREGKPLLPGGCLLFGYNIADTPAGVFDYLTEIKAYYNANSNVPPFIAVDQEGGDVCRLRKITSRFPSQETMASIITEGQNDLAAGQEIYSAQARQMSLLGIHMNLAPVIEAANECNAVFLADRTFGSMENVLKCGKMEIDCFENNRVATVLKHFPGNSNTDPHTGLPEISVTKKQFEEDFLLPFRQLCSLSSSVLMSHARIRVTDDDSFDCAVPAGLSKFWVTDVLRNQLGFEGVVFSDDIFMGALNDNGFPPEKAVVMAIEAGVDCIMLSEKRFGSVAGILLKKAAEDTVFAQRIDEACGRIIAMKARMGILDYVLNENQNGSISYSLCQPLKKINREGVLEDFQNEKKSIQQKGYIN